MEIYHIFSKSNFTWLLHIVNINFRKFIIIFNSGREFSSSYCFHIVHYAFKQFSLFQSDTSVGSGNIVFQSDANLSAFFFLFFVLRYFFTKLTLIKEKKLLKKMSITQKSNITIIYNNIFLQYLFIYLFQRKPNNTKFTLPNYSNFIQFKFVFPSCNYSSVKLNLFECLLS